MTDFNHRAQTTAAAPLRIVCSISLCLMLGACAGGPGLPGMDGMQLATNSTAPTSDAASASASIDPTADLGKATAYWGQQFAKQPANLEAALSYAKNLKAMGQKRKALAVLQQASIFHGNNKELAGEYGRLALSLGQVAVASKVLAVADDPTKPDWKIISARGAALAKQSKFSEAIPLFERALTLANNHPSVLNNLALAHAMNGQPGKAETLLRQATASGAEGKKVRQNLALVLGLQGKYEEASQIAALDLPMNKAQERVAEIRQMVKLAPVAPSVNAASSMLASAGGWSTATSALRPTNTAVAPTGQSAQAVASR
ncbi:MAG: tetratricopeptide repeat protein [Pseudomonadota bacterium]